jgi:O-antigen/teichoic acid export membrane protein
MTVQADPPRDATDSSAAAPRAQASPAERVPMFRKLLALLSDATIYGASSLIGQFIGVLLVPLLTYYLSKAEMGVVGMLTIIPRVFLPLANLGMTNAIFRRFHQEKDEAGRQRVLSSGLTSVLGSAVVLCLIALVCEGLIADTLLGTREYDGLVLLSIVSAAIACIGNVPRVALRANRNVKSAAGLNVLNVVVYAATTVAFVVFMENGVRGVVLGLLCGDVITTVVALACTRHYFRPALDVQTWRGMLRYGLPFVPHHVQAVLLSDLFGRYVIRQNLGLGDVGLYDVAGKFATPVLFVVTAVQTSWVAHKFQVHAEDEDSPSFFRSTFTYYCAGLFYLWLGVSVWGPELLRVLASSQFEAGASLIPVIALIPVAQGLYYMLGTGMELTDDTKAYPLISLSGLITVAIASFVMVQAWGAYGAALATTSGWLVMAITAYVLAQRRFPIEYDWPAVISIMGLAILVVAGSLAIQDQTALLRVAVALGASIVYPAIVYMFLRRSASERERMQILWGMVVRRFSFLRSLRSQSASNQV